MHPERIVFLGATDATHSDSKSTSAITGTFFKETCEGRPLTSQSDFTYGRPLILQLTSRKYFVQARHQPEVAIATNRTTAIIRGDCFRLIICPFRFQIKRRLSGRRSRASLYLADRGSAHYRCASDGRVNLIAVPTPGRLSA